MSQAGYVFPPHDRHETAVHAHAEDFDGRPAGRLKIGSAQFPAQARPAIRRAPSFPNRRLRPDARREPIARLRMSRSPCAANCPSIGVNDLLRRFIHRTSGERSGGVLRSITSRPATSQSPPGFPTATASETAQSSSSCELPLAIAWLVECPSRRFCDAPESNSERFQMLDL